MFIGCLTSLFYVAKNVSVCKPLLQSYGELTLRRGQPVWTLLGNYLEHYEMCCCSFVCQWPWRCLHCTWKDIIRRNAKEVRPCHDTRYCFLIKPVDLSIIWFGCCCCFISRVYPDYTRKKNEEDMLICSLCACGRIYTHINGHRQNDGLHTSIYHICKYKNRNTTASFMLLTEVRLAASLLCFVLFLAC